MPILDVEMIVAPGETEAPDIARAIADAAAAVFGAPPGSTWVRFHTLSAEDYAENAVPAAETPAPVFVRVLKRGLPDADTLRAEASGLAAVVAAACSRPTENVHIIYEPPGGGRVAFGGQLSGG